MSREALDALEAWHSTTLALREATPWTAEWPFKASDARLFPVECHEGNYAIEHFLRGARAEEQRKTSSDR